MFRFYIMLFTLSLTSLSTFSQGEALFGPFLRYKDTLSLEEAQETQSELMQTNSWVSEWSRWFRAPSGLFLVVSDSVDQAVYRGGEIVVPYRFDGQASTGTEEERQKQRRLARAYQDYFYALALFDHNMELDHPIFQIYHESLALAREQKRLQVFIDEDEFLIASGSSPSELSERYEEDFIRNRSQARADLAKVEAKMNSYKGNRKHNEIVAYVLYFHGAIQYLFADLFVALRNGGNPEAMREVLENVPGLKARAQFRSLSPIEESDWSQWIPAKEDKLFYPMRAKLWKEIATAAAVRNNPADAFLVLENIFLRLRLVYKEVLDKIQARSLPLGVEGAYTSLGETVGGLWTALGLKPEDLFHKLDHGFCEINLEGDWTAPPSK